MSPDKKVTVSRGLTLRTWKGRRSSELVAEMTRADTVARFLTQRQDVLIWVRVALCAVLHQEVGAVPGHADNPVRLVQQDVGEHSPVTVHHYHLAVGGPEQDLSRWSAWQKEICVNSSQWLKSATLHRHSEEASVHLLIVRRPDAAGDLTLQVDLRWPVSLSADGADQDETVPVGDERLGAVMWPSEVTHLEERKALVALRDAFIWDLDKNHN